MTRRPTDGRGGAGGQLDVLSLPTPSPLDDGSNPVATSGEALVDAVVSVLAVLAVVFAVLRAVVFVNI